MSTTRDPRTHRGYARHLTDADLGWLAALGGRDDVHAAAMALRADPRRLAETLESPETHEALFPREAPPADGDPLLRTSPFLVFAVAVHRAHADLASRTYVNEWVGAGQRLPVFATPELRAVLDDDLTRLYLAEMLASYTHVSSGTIWVRTRRGPRRRRVSELDLRHLASLLEVLPTEAHARVYRRLGDLALLLTGVFPDHTAARLFGQADLHVLGRTLTEAGGSQLGEALESRGGVGLLELLGSRWYRSALAALPGEPEDTWAALSAVADRFADLRRILNLVTDRYLFPYRGRWFPAVGG